MGVSQPRDAAWLRDGKVARLLAMLDRDGEEARQPTSRYFVPHIVCR